MRPNGNASPFVRAVTTATTAKRAVEIRSGFVREKSANALAGDVPSSESTCCKTMVELTFNGTWCKSAVRRTYGGARVAVVTRCAVTCE